MSNQEVPFVSLADVLRPETIKLDLESTTRDEVLAELVAQIPEIANDPAARAQLLHALIEREKLHTTGVGDGVALPHARNALVGLVEQPVIVFGRHKTGIPFDAIDGKPAQLFFLIVAPTVTQHLSLLARISRLARDPAFRKALLGAESPAEIIKIIRDAENALRNS